MQTDTHIHADAHANAHANVHAAQAAAHLDSLFFALADASRRGMLERLSAGPASVSELARPLGMALPSVVKHLAVLESGGLVLSEKAGRVRTYRMAPRALAAMDAWVNAHKARLNAQFDRLETYLAAQAAGETP